jgi:hypothetical protein
VWTGITLTFRNVGCVDGGKGVNTKTWCGNLENIWTEGQKRTEEGITSCLSTYLKSPGSSAEWPFVPVAL